MWGSTDDGVKKNVAMNVFSEMKISQFPTVNSFSMNVMFQRPVVLFTSVKWFFIEQNDLSYILILWSEWLVALV